jgi:hypothetical protein
MKKIIVAALALCALTACKDMGEFHSCQEASKAHAAPLHRGEAGYGADLDRDGDGVACEK